MNIQPCFYIMEFPTYQGTSGFLTLFLRIPSIPLPTYLNTPQKNPKHTLENSPWRGETKRKEKQKKQKSTQEHYLFTWHIPTYNQEVTKTKKKINIKIKWKQTILLRPDGFPLCGGSGLAILAHPGEAKLYSIFDNGLAAGREARYIRCYGCDSCVWTFKDKVYNHHDIPEGNTYLPSYHMARILQLAKSKRYEPPILLFGVYQD